MSQPNYSVLACAKCVSIVRDDGTVIHEEKCENRPIVSAPPSIGPDTLIGEIGSLRQDDYYSEVLLRNLKPVYQQSILCAKEKEERIKELVSQANKDGITMKEQQDRIVQLEKQVKELETQLNDIL